MFLSSILFFLSLLFCSLTKNIWIFVVLFASSFGLSIGILYMIPLNIGIKYYPEKKGLICGIVLGMFGISGVLI